jgi:hypothetical protein
MKAFNIRSDKQLADNVTIADTLLKRMKGLLGKKEMLNGEALSIKPCISVHTFFMKFPIDIVFLNKRNQVIAAIRNLQPNRITGFYFKSTSVLELPASVLEATDTRVGDEIEIS